MLFRGIISLSLIGTAIATGRPSSTSICDYYTTGLLKDNTAKNQYALLTLLVNTAVIGNYTEPSNGVLVPGILNPKGMYNGVPVNLLPYFNGCFVSTNTGEAYDLKNNPPKSVNFLDGGGAAPLMNNMPASDMTSAQYFLLTHLYQYFGALLGCSKYGTTDFPAYGGEGSLYRVHQYMGLDSNEVNYFITQVGLSAASFGVAQSDINIVASTLSKTFGYKCSPPVTIIPAQGPVLDSICTGSNCPKDPNAKCELYDNNYGNSPRPAVAPQCMSQSSSSMAPSPTCPGQYTVTVTVTKKPKQTHMWCHKNWQSGDEHKWCN
ncbi:Hypothetical protein R9X50_00014400 [Acrodontium crateriforme]|uniref:Uncharacterized protein n=1 Tax=Acrodontium crateriforme TaxID=150365 RepID=A0AAQ3LWX8_9PEZI|nr:Hypothetical protein R9X50_00014400 [Acrodontium crateriforme]